MMKADKNAGGRGNPASRRVVSNDKGTVSKVVAKSEAPSLSALITRRHVLLSGLAAVAVASVAGMRSRAALGAITPEPDFGSYKQQVLIRWGDPLWSTAPAVELTALKPQDAAQRFGYNNDFITFLPLPYGSTSSDHGLLVANHEYPVPHLMFKGVTRDSVPQALTDEQVATTLESVGLSVVEIKRGDAGWAIVEDSKFNRRVTGTTPIKFSGPAAGHLKMQTSADLSGHTVLGTHDNCNGGVTPWGTVLSGEEGSQDFLGGDISSAPDYDLLMRYHYDDSTPTGKYGWPGYDKRFDIATEPNEPNRFEWVVELDPYDPAAVPVKRTALGRFAHEGAHCTLAPDGRVVVYMGDDWEFEYCYRFVTDRAYNPDNRIANKDLLDEGVLSVACFSEDGTVLWKSLVYGKGPLTAANGFADQGDVLIQTRRAADLLGATPMDSPEGYMPDPSTGKVYITLSGNEDRAEATVNAANPRAMNKSGHLLELTPPDSGAGPDHAATMFEWQVRLLCDEDTMKASGFHPATKTNGYFYAPDNINFDPEGAMWICSDGPNVRGEDGLWKMETRGENAWLSQLFFLSPQGAECCGPAFTPDGKTMFVAIQHPGQDSASIKDAITRWPDFVDGEPPRPSVIAVMWE
ncbi:PhoX family protein [Kordiimonas pumila]|uniref:PhoX family protein n=1 Tax=Kordiimonas pumila TaxID=2161677 RepID=A0ABV7D8F5_9PROT|nr:PhoX family phosphatase [Kordiimonas pumila]